MLNQSNEVLMVTNYKDNHMYSKGGKKWKDCTKMINEKIVPLLR